MNCETLARMTVNQLRNLAGSLGIARYSIKGQRLNKAGLIQHIASHQQQAGELQALRDEVQKLRAELDEARRQIGTAATRATTTSPATAASSWTAEALRLVQDFQKRNPYGMAPLPWLFSEITRRHALTIGQYHDGLRELVQARRLRLHPFTGSFSELEGERFCLLAAQEIKMYAQALA